MKGKSWTSGTIRRQEIGKDHKKGGAAALNITYQAILSQWGGKGRSPWEAGRSKIEVHVSQWPGLTANAWEFAEDPTGFKRGWQRVPGTSEADWIVVLQIHPSVINDPDEEGEQFTSGFQETYTLQKHRGEGRFSQKFTWHWKSQASFSVSPPDPLSQRRPKSWL